MRGEGGPGGLENNIRGTSYDSSICTNTDVLNRIEMVGVRERECIIGTEDYYWTGRRVSCINCRTQLPSTQETLRLKNNT